MGRWLGGRALHATERPATKRQVPSPSALPAATNRLCYYSRAALHHRYAAFERCRVLQRRAGLERLRRHRRALH